MEVFGGNFIEIVIGGAPFNPEVEAFLRKINFPYTIAYGMTEAAPLICTAAGMKYCTHRVEKQFRIWKQRYCHPIRNASRENWYAGE